MKKIDINEIKGYGKFAVILKCLLAKNHVTQVELADAIGLSGATITNYVKGRSTPTQQNLEKIAKFLKVTPQTFYSDTNDFVPYINQYEKTFAEKLSQLLKEREISQEELSAKLGLSRQTINYYVNGKTMPMPDILSSKCSDELFHC